jgi:hypothetical protein
MGGADPRSVLAVARRRFKTGNDNASTCNNSSASGFLTVLCPAALLRGADTMTGRITCLLLALGNTLADVSGLTELELRCVQPFYLKMMRLNALNHDDSVEAVRDVARATTDEEVGCLLASSWRPRVMGAWLTAGRAHRVEAALLTSLETSAGSLTAPPLATIALHGLGQRAAPSLITYLIRAPLPGGPGPEDGTGLP